VERFLYATLIRKGKKTQAHMPIELHSARITGTGRRLIRKITDLREIYSSLCLTFMLRWNQ
jgi:hypothetical protein